MWLLDWLFGSSYGPTPPQREIGPLTAQDITLAQMQRAMTPQEILEHQIKMLTLTREAIDQVKPVWNGKIWYPLEVKNESFCPNAIPTAHNLRLAKENLFGRRKND